MTSIFLKNIREEEHGKEVIVMVLVFKKTQQKIQRVPIQSFFYPKLIKTALVTKLVKISDKWISESFFIKFQNT